MKKRLTVYNTEVQKWTGRPSRTKKVERLAMFIENYEGIFDQAFTSARRDVLDEILYLSSATGICTVKGQTLADKTGVKIRTVRAAVKEIKKTDEFVIAQTANGRCGAYVFIDKKHENFKLIMKDLFDIDVEENDDKHDDSNNENSSNTHLDAPVDAVVDAPLENSESVDTKEIEDKNDTPINLSLSSNSLKYLKPKQEGPVNLYGKVCKLLKTAGKNTMVTQLMRLYEKAKNNIMGLTEDHLIYALNESITRNASDIVAYTASIIYNTQKQSRTSHSKPVLQVDESKLPSWFKDKTHKKHVDETVSNEQAINFEEEVRKINAQYNL